jgi:hypothetical protein
MLKYRNTKFEARNKFKIMKIHVWNFGFKTLGFISDFVLWI